MSKLIFIPLLALTLIGVGCQTEKTSSVDFINEVINNSVNEVTKTSESECDKNIPCSGDFVCLNNRCVSTAECSSDEDCRPGSECFKGTCQIQEPAVPVETVVEGNNQVVEEQSDWQAFIYQNTIGSAFDLSFQYPKNYVIVGPCTSQKCLLGSLMLLFYKQGTEPDSATFIKNSESGFAGGDLWFQWYLGDKELKDIIDANQVNLASGVQKTYGRITGTEFTRVGQGSVNLFIFKSVGHTFVVTDANPNRLADFPRADWERILSSITVVER
ncbi:MAG: EB domain-containing protein [Candidatus Uhrbacteria bacterium]